MHVPALFTSGYAQNVNILVIVKAPAKYHMFERNSGKK